MCVKFFFVSLTFVFISSVDSYPICDSSTPSLRPEYRDIPNGFPTIISYGPIFVGSLKGGIAAEEISLLPTGGSLRPEETNPIVIAVDDCKGKHTMEDIKLEPLNAPSDYYEYAAGQQLTSPQLHFIQTLDMHREKEHGKEIEKHLEILNQLQPGREDSKVEEPEKPQAPTSMVEQETEYPETKKPSGFLKPMSEFSAQLTYTPHEASFQGSLNYPIALAQITEAKPSTPGAEDVATGPTSASFAQALSKYIQNTIPPSTMIYPCNYPKDSTYVAKKQEDLIRQFANELGEHIKEIFDRVKRYKESAKEDIENKPTISSLGKLGLAFSGFTSGKFKHHHIMNVGA